MREIFPSLFGNNAVKELIGHDIVKGTNSHAYIIQGPEGSGKHTLARLIAASLSCENRTDSTSSLPCGECGNCHRIFKGISGDVVYISKGEKASIGVDVIRSLRSGVYVTPNDSDKRTYIIEEAEKMTTEAQNAFLLTLEEPPSFVVFILLTEDASLLLETVRSRAQTVGTEIFSSEKLGEYLEKTDKGRLLKLRDPDKFNAVLSLSGGVIGYAEKLISDGEENASLMGLRDTVYTLLTLMCRPKAAPMLKEVFSSKLTQRREAKEFLTLLSSAVRDLINLKKSQSANFVYFISNEDALNVSNKLSIKKLFYIQDEIERAATMLESNVSAKTALTNMILRIANYKR